MDSIKNKISLLFLFSFFVFSCSKNKQNKGYDYSVFSKHINIFGVKILATEETNDQKVNHAANVLAQYIDNDEDGIPDNSKVMGYPTKDIKKFILENKQ